MKKFLRGYRLANPGRDIQLIFLPRGSPYLNVVEECWNLLKKAVARHYCYRGSTTSAGPSRITSGPPGTG